MSGNASRRTDVGVGEQQCWCRGTCMLVSADEHSCQATSTLRTFCTSRTLCTLRTVYALFACFLRTLSSLGTLCTVRTLTWRACIDAFFDALFTHFLRTFCALFTLFLCTFYALCAIYPVYSHFTHFLPNFCALFMPFAHCTQLRYFVHCSHIDMARMHKCIFDALFTHFLRTFCALFTHFLRTFHAPFTHALFTHFLRTFTHFLRTFYALYPV